MGAGTAGSRIWQTPAELPMPPLSGTSARAVLPAPCRRHHLPGIPLPREAAAPGTQELLTDCPAGNDPSLAVPEGAREETRESTALTRLWSRVCAAHLWAASGGLCHGECACCREGRLPRPVVTGAECSQHCRMCVPVPRFLWGFYRPRSRKLFQPGPLEAPGLLRGGRPCCCLVVGAEALFSPGLWLPVILFSSLGTWKCNSCYFLL